MFIFVKTLKISNLETQTIVRDLTKCRILNGKFFCQVEYTTFSTTKHAFYARNN
jgi:hypothetical protein